MQLHSGEYNIEKWAQGASADPIFDGGAYEEYEDWFIPFPFYGNVTGELPSGKVAPEHPINRWNNNVNTDDVKFIARLGDNIAFRDLPSTLKTSAVATFFGADTQADVLDGGIVICGSPGEVGNDATLTEHFDVRSDEQTTTSGTTLNNQKSVVWTEIALSKDDQLRQRVAWALAQLVTVVPGNIDGFDRTEIYLNYYDIFVRHAFGNYRDILSE